MGQLGAPVVAIAGEQAHIITVDAGKDAITVELDLVAPVAIGRGVDQGRQLWLQLRRQLHLRGFAGGLATWRRGLFCCRLARHQRAVAEHAVGLGVDDAVVGFAARLAVVRLDQHPLFLLAGQVGAEQVPYTAELFALQAETQLALGIGLARIAFGFPDAAIPDDHIACTVMAFGDMAFEVGVVQRVVLHVHGQAAHLGVQRRPFGDGPAFQRAIEFQAKVVMQVAGIVLLDAELQCVGPLATAALAAGLGRGIEVALARIFLQGLGHGGLRAVRSL
ncbi:hypothetical protein D3C79_666960 [compost metagenome]